MSIVAELIAQRRGGHGEPMSVASATGAPRDADKQTAAGANTQRGDRGTNC